MKTTLSEWLSTNLKKDAKEYPFKIKTIAPAAMEKKIGSCKHSKDFSSVKWYGVRYVFAYQQALCVAELWAAWENDTPTLREMTIGEAVDASTRSKFRLANVFKKHPAWGTMIQPAGKGIFKLEKPK